MSVASFSYIKISNPSSPSQPPSCSSSSSTYSTHHHHSYNRFSPTKPSVVTVRYSQADGPLRRPVATPPLRPPTAPTTPTPPSASSPPPPPPPPPVAPPKPASTSSVTAVGDKNVITMEFQRLKAKELQEYFKRKKIEEANLGPFFGFLAKNEISNGRWAMFGFAVGMLTEYATGSDFVDQVKILLSNFGIVDLD